MYGLMSNAHTPILVGVTSPVSEILKLSKMIKYRLKEFMQVWIDVTCMYTDFGGCGLSGFGDTTALKNGQISLSDHGL